jgi:hypothetical protein
MHFVVLVFSFMGLCNVTAIYSYGPLRVTVYPVISQLKPHLWNDKLIYNPQTHWQRALTCYKPINITWEPLNPSGDIRISASRDAHLKKSGWLS